MSTRSRIKIQRRDFTSTSIYCHYDGYIEGVGLTLQLAFNTAEKVEKLLALGNLSVLGYYTEPDPSKPHEFGNGQDCVCIAYHRDRGEEFEQWDSEQEFNYTFDEYEGVWYVTSENWVVDTFGTRLLDLTGYSGKSTRLLIDAIHDIDFSAIKWADDEFATADGLLGACVKKALEGRQNAMEYNWL